MEVALEWLLLHSPNVLLSSRFRYSAEAGIVIQEQIANMEGVYFKIGAVTGYEKPMTNFISQQIDRTKGWKLSS
jgi:hypothetical protein